MGKEQNDGQSSWPKKAIVILADIAVPPIALTADIYKGDSNKSAALGGAVIFAGLGLTFGWGLHEVKGLANTRLTDEVKIVRFAGADLRPRCVTGLMYAVTPVVSAFIDGFSGSALEFQRDGTPLENVIPPDNTIRIKGANILGFSPETGYFIDEAAPQKLPLEQRRFQYNYDRYNPVSVEARVRKLEEDREGLNAKVLSLLAHNRVVRAQRLQDNYNVKLASAQQRRDECRAAQRQVRAHLESVVAKLNNTYQSIRSGALYRR